MNVERVRRLIKIMQLLQSGRRVDTEGLAAEFDVLPPVLLTLEEGLARYDETAPDEAKA